MSFDWGGGLSGVINDVGGSLSLHVSSGEADPGIGEGAPHT